MSQSSESSYRALILRSAPGTTIDDAVEPEKYVGQDVVVLEAAESVIRSRTWMNLLGS